jgi:hypothetical protein
VTAVRVGVCCLALACGASRTAAAQDTLRTGVTVRGSVIAGETIAPLPYSSVELVPGFPRRLADDSGRFHFAGVRPGRYHVLIRQIGYLPFDSLIVVPDDVRAPFVVSLFRIGITLPAVTVRARVECRRPGAPNPAVTPALAAVFDQVVENARRARLVADSFPFTYRVERTLAERTRDGQRRVTRTDTLSGTAREREYRPGRLVGPGFGARAGERVVHIPTLRAFAETAFVSHHCFRLAGRDTLQGGTFIRLDFEPAASFKEADVQGAAYLDSATYLIRYTVVRVTRPRRVSRHLASLVVTSRFKEIAPWILIPEHVFAERRPRDGKAPVEEEEQRVVEVVRPPAPRP